MHELLHSRFIAGASHGRTDPLISSKLVLWVALPWVAVLLLKAMESWIHVRLSSESLDVPTLLRSELPILATGVLITPIALWLGFSMPLTRVTWPRRLALLAPAVVLAAVLVNVLRTCAWIALGLLPGVGNGTSTILLQLTSVFHVDVINVSWGET